MPCVRLELVLNDTYTQSTDASDSAPNGAKRAARRTHSQVIAEALERERERLKAELEEERGAAAEQVVEWSFEDVVYETPELRAFMDRQLRTTYRGLNWTRADLFRWWGWQNMQLEMQQAQQQQSPF